MAHVADRLPAHPTARPAGAPAVAADLPWSGRLARGLSWGAFLVVVLLGFGAPAQRTGDAHQYHAMAGALARLRPPALTSEETVAYKSWLLAQPPASGFAGGVRAVDQPALIRDGRQEFSHFWLYPLLVAPFVAATDLLGLHRADAFLAANALLLGAALWAVGRWCRPVVPLLLLASPLLWFVDKAQVEVFTASWLALAMVAAVRGRYPAAAFFAAVASTQNLPIAAAVPLFWGAGLGRWVADHQQLVDHGQTRRSAPLIRRPIAQRWAVPPEESTLPPAARDRGAGGEGVLGQPTPRPSPAPATVALVAATILVALLHPAYYRWRLGVITPQELNGGIAAGVPSPSRYLAPLVDPDIGLLPWAPLLGGLVIAGAVVLLRPAPAAAAWHSPDRRWAAACAVALGAWFLLAFSQTSNVNSGGTVHVSRYALWLLPLAIPFLDALAGRLEGPAPALLPALGAVAFVAYALLFRPGQPERYVVPSPQAAFVGDWLGGLYRPVPEVFFERHQGLDGGVSGSAANAACTLLLLTDGAPDPPCPPTAAERAAAARLHAAGWRAVWVGREGRLRLGDTEVSGAVRR